MAMAIAVSSCMAALPTAAPNRSFRPLGSSESRPQPAGAANFVGASSASISSLFRYDISCAVRQFRSTACRYSCRRVPVREHCSRGFRGLKVVRRGSDKEGGECRRRFWFGSKGVVESFSGGCGRQAERVGTCRARLDSEEVVSAVEPEMEDPVTAVKQVALWVMAAVYTSWLFLLPYAPGDPVWAISPATITGILGLSLNFFYVLPLANMVGFHLLEAAVAHPADEALFNFVLGWALLFAPLIFTDRKRNRFTGSLDAFWLMSMFLTNTFLIPYMAIRLNAILKRDSEPLKISKTRDPDSGYGTSALQQALTSGAGTVAVVGATVGLLSILWFVVGRPAGGYGGLAERWSYFVGTLGRDRPAYAFIWDLCCYTVFQPWLIGDNLHNIRREKQELVQALRFVPYVGAIAYCWGLKSTDDRERSQSKLK